VTYYHGGVPGKAVGALLVPSAPHAEDGCPVCQARAAGLVITVGEYRAWLYTQGPRALPVLRALADAPDGAALDPPPKRQAVYFTSDRAYARLYAARSRGDLYEVRPVGPVARSDEDPFPTWTAGAATVVRVLERRVRLARADRRALQRRWRKADRTPAPRGSAPAEPPKEAR
jgi:hypothetical protein